jgi:hypothetical protein
MASIKRITTSIKTLEDAEREFVNIIKQVEVILTQLEKKINETRISNS